MVTKKTIGCVGRRMLLAFLASAGSAGITAMPATAQTGIHMPPVTGPATAMGLSDIKLAPGETIVGTPTTTGGGTIQHGGGSYQIVDSSSVPTAADPLAEPMTSEVPMMIQSPMPMPGYGGCATGNCGGYGVQGYGHSAGHGMGHGVGMSGNACGTICNPYLYASGEALYFMNTNVDNYSRTRDAFLEDFDFELGYRATLGMVPDCRNGYEVSFTGPFEWDSQETTNGNNLGTFLTNRGGLPLLSSFQNATFQQQRYEADYSSFEANRTIIGWEICKLLYGIRYVNYDEEYRYDSTSAAGSGVLRSITDNQMIGAQIGAEMTFPITCKVWSDFRGRAGAYGNFADSDYQLVNAGTTLVRSFDDDVELAGLFEIGGGVRYYVTDDFHIRAGSELWYMAGVATSIDQFDARIRPNTGRSINIDDDILMVGVSLGAELKF